MTHYTHVISLRTKGTFIPNAQQNPQIFSFREVPSLTPMGDPDLKKAKKQKEKREPQFNHEQIKKWSWVTVIWVHVTTLHRNSS